jgi:hypothetical protein
MPRKFDSPHGPWYTEQFGPDISPSRLKKYMTCPQQYEYHYVRKEESHTGLAAMQGTALHDVFLEEFLMDGVDDIDALIDLLEITYRDALEKEDPRDYKTGEPPSEFDIEQSVDQLKIWGRGLLEAFKNGKDSYGNEFRLPVTIDTEVEKPPLEVYLPRSNTTIRIRGSIDLMFEDGGLGDLKLASDYYLAVWTHGKTFEEVQPAMYRLMVGGPGKFSYVIVDKKKSRGNDAFSPSVRTIDFDISEKDIQRVVNYLDDFVMRSQIQNDHKNGFFEPLPKYAGEKKANAGMPEKQFCEKLCSFKDLCWQENFAPLNITNDGVTLED